MPRSLEDRLNAEPAKGWKPEAGDRVIGEIVSISQAPGTDWGPYPLIEVETDDGEAVAVHAFHTVLRTEIERLAPSEGDRIGIKFLGKKQGSKQEYEGYTVVLERKTPRTADTPVMSAAPAAASVPTNGAPASPASPSWDEEDPY